MFQLLLVIIYLAFISLGLPDALLGSAWPSMYRELHVPVSWVGIISMIIAGGTILSSLQSDRLIRIFGAGKVTAASVAMTAAALLGFSSSHAFLPLCLWSVPYGLGAGSVDAALNNFVALHYESRHMSWLHCFWGIGATSGPYIMGLCLTNGLRWNSGYLAIGAIQIILVFCLVLSLPLWRKKENSNGIKEEGSQRGMNLAETVRLPGAVQVLTAFFCYCALETTAGLWAGSYLVLYKGIHAETAARWSAFFYLGITAGRLVCGFISGRLGDAGMIRIGQAVASFGVILLMLPLQAPAALFGLICAGAGCAPVFPSLLHQTPKNFGEEHSQAVMGVQMACAYAGTTFMPPVFGLLADRGGIGFYPFYLAGFIAVMVVMTERRRLSIKKYLYK